MIIKLGVIGVGKRFKATYPSVLKQLALDGEIEVVGVYDKDKEAAVVAGDEFGWEVFDSQEELLELADIDGVMVIVPAVVKDRIALAVLRASKHFFVESPAGYSPYAAKLLLKESLKRGLVVEVGEDEAFWPTVREQKMQVDQGEIGRVVEIMNDRREYAYHAFARMNVLLGGLSDVRSMSARVNKLKGGGSLDQYDVNFKSGLRYIHRFVRPRGHEMEGRPRWEVKGVEGNLLDDDEREYHEEGLRYLLNGWIEAIQGRRALCYGLEKGVMDVELWRATEMANRFSGVLFYGWLITGLSNLVWVLYARFKQKVS